MRFDEDYRVGDAARWAGISRSYVRYLEGRGVIGPSRTGDGNYRRYTPDDLIVLAQFMQYRDMGVPADEAVDLLSEDASQARRRLLAHRARLEAEHRRTMRAIDGGLDRMRRAGREEVEACMSPGFWCFEIPEDMPADRRRDMSPDEARRVWDAYLLWRSAMPQVSYGMLYREGEDRANRCRCMVAAGELPPELCATLDVGVTRVDPGPCARLAYPVTTDDVDGASLSPLLAEATAAGFAQDSARPCVAVVLHLRRLGDTIRSDMALWVPTLPSGISR